RRSQSRGEMPQARLCRRKRFAYGEQPGHNPFDIAIDRRRWLVEGNRRYGGCRIRPDSWEPEELCFRARELAVVLLDNLAGATVEIAGSTVVAESSPGTEDVIEVCRCERLNCWPAS